MNGFIVLGIVIYACLIPVCMCLFLKDPKFLSSACDHDCNNCCMQHYSDCGEDCDLGLTYVALAAIWPIMILIFLLVRSVKRMYIPQESSPNTNYNVYQIPINTNNEIESKLPVKLIESKSPVKLIGSAIKKYFYIEESTGPKK